LGENYTMDVHRIDGDTPVAIPKEEFGHFFSDEVYTIDLKGKKHRYFILWIGRKMPKDELAKVAEVSD
jgi:hypothetical protein